MGSIRCVQWRTSLKKSQVHFLHIKVCVSRNHYRLHAINILYFCIWLNHVCGYLRLCPFYWSANTDICLQHFYLCNQPYNTTSYMLLADYVCAFGKIDGQHVSFSRLGNLTGTFWHHFSDAMNCWSWQWISRFVVSCLAFMVNCERIVSWHFTAKMLFYPVLLGEKTSIRTICLHVCLFSEYLWWHEVLFFYYY